MVLSREAVRRMTGHGCPALDYPDDLFLGSTARQLGVHIVHSPLFHQVQYTTVYYHILWYTTAYHSIACMFYKKLFLPYSPSQRATLPLSLGSRLPYHFTDTAPRIPPLYTSNTSLTVSPPGRQKLNYSIFH